MDLVLSKWQFCVKPHVGTGTSLLKVKKNFSKSLPHHVQHNATFHSVPLGHSVKPFQNHFTLCVTPSYCPAVTPGSGVSCSSSSLEVSQVVNSGIIPLCIISFFYIPDCTFQHHITMAILYFHCFNYSLDFNTFLPLMQQLICFTCFFHMLIYRSI